MTFQELLSHFATFGVSRDELVPMLSNCDLGSPEKMKAADRTLGDLKMKARKGFRKVAMPLHADRNPDPEAHKEYKRLAAVMQIIRGLTVGALHGLYDATFEQHTQHYEDAPIDHMGRTFEDAQRESFMAFAKHYKGPMIPVGWHPGVEPQPTPPTSSDSNRTFVKQLPNAADLVDADPRDGVGPRRKR